MAKKPDLFAELFRAGKQNWGWVCRDSVSGRGIRLHQTNQPVGAEHPNGGLVCPTPVDAVTDYLWKRSSSAAEQGAGEGEG